MNDNRLNLTFDQRYEAVRQRDIDMDADINVAVQTKFSALGIVGSVLLGLGALLLLAGAIMFGVYYPGDWNQPGDELTTLILGSGLTLAFTGSAMFFHGRTVLGAGALDHMHIDTSAQSDHPSTFTAQPAGTPATQAGQQFQAVPPAEPQIPGYQQAEGAPFPGEEPRMDPWSEVQE